MISRSHRNKPSSRQGTPILLSDIKYNSTCITLKLGKAGPLPTNDV